MPLQIENNYDQVSLMDLVGLRTDGYSVMKSPHVGNQHPSNLVCAALGIPLEMVSFTRGLQDKNFHPHTRIQGGVQTSLYDANTWTPFAAVSEKRDVATVSFFPDTYEHTSTAVQYHQSSVQRLFPNTEIMTDMERMQQYPALTAAVLRATNVKRNQSVWYRRVSSDGVVTKRSKGKLSESELETDVFQFSNDRSGYVVPNKVHIIFSLIYQSLSSGRDVVYHLSGPQMTQYIDGLQSELSLLYDQVRHLVPDLPFTLKVRVVPVASARFVTTKQRRDGLTQLRAIADQLSVDVVAREFVSQYPEYTAPIESGTTLSQYDFAKKSDVIQDPDMWYMPLAEVIRLHQRLLDVAQQVAVAAE